MSLKSVPIALLATTIAAPLLFQGVAKADAPSDNQVRGGAQAVAMRLIPYVGVPGFAGALGITTAQVDSGTAAASASVADLGLAGTLINSSASQDGQAPPLELPEPISASSGRTEKVERYPFNPPGAPAPPQGSPAGAHEIATATEKPLAALGSVTGPEIDVPGVLRVTGGLSRSAADPTRAIGEVTLGQLALGDNVVVLSGMRWSALKVPGKAAVQSFSLGSMTIAGQAMPVETGEELAASFAAANKALEPTGLSIGVPAVVGNANEAAVAPLVLQLRSPESLVDPSAQVGTVTKPLLLGVAKAVLDSYPDAAAAGIVVNALVGASSGRSGGRLELGGVSARSDLLPAVDVGSAIPSVPTPSVPAVPPVSAVPPVPSGTPILPEEIDAPVPAADCSDGATEPGVTQDCTPLGSIDMRGAATGPQTLGAAPASQSDDLGGRTRAALALGIGLALLLALAVAERMRAV
ncbi:MAG: hypothetical protein ACT4QF_12200 [Sporichthyaceae bacterium]